MKKGFTLIELLVVVLIIGILAAIALPQYEMAVMKARWSTMLPIMKSLKDAHELFYMTNGYYETDTSKLDIQHPCTNTDALQCPGGFWLDNLGGHGVVSAGKNMYLVVFYCPGIADFESCGAQADYSYTIYLDHSDRPGERSCLGRTDKGRRFCKNIQAL